MKYVAPVLVGILLTACASSDRVRHQAPLYAIPAERDTYRVTCNEGSARVIYVQNVALDTFYHSDGSEKTEEEFCRERTRGEMER